MTKIHEQLAEGPTFSVEVFPPKTDEGRDKLRGALEELSELGLSYVSCTYGAGGSTRDRTREVVRDIQEVGITAMPHLTCVAHTRAELVELVESYRDEGIENLLALHGDLPKDDPGNARGELTRAYQLVELAREVGDFSVGVAAHPEGHPNAPDLETDRRHQAEKLKVADFAMTQFFFDADDYLRLIDDLAKHGVETPIIPGIIPITNAKQVQRFAELSGAEFPPDLAERLERVADDEAEVRRIGVEVATELCQHLLDKGAPGLHIYALNRAEATKQVHANLGLSSPR